MFITLKVAASGEAITFNVDRITTMYDAPSPATGTIVENADGGIIRVAETRAQILAELGRLERQRFTPGESLTERRDPARIALDVIRENYPPDSPTQPTPANLEVRLQMGEVDADAVRVMLVRAARLARGEA